MKFLSLFTLLILFCSTNVFANDLFGKWQGNGELRFNNQEATNVAIEMEIEKNENQLTVTVCWDAVEQLDIIGECSSRWLEIQGARLLNSEGVVGMISKISILYRVKDDFALITYNPEDHEAQLLLKNLDPNNGSVLYSVQLKSAAELE